MTLSSVFRRVGVIQLVLLGVTVSAFGGDSPPDASTARDPQRFKNPDEALKALREACKGCQKAGLTAVFGAATQDLCSGDDVQDAADLKEFQRMLSQRAKCRPDGSDRVIVLIGPDDYPFAIPIVKQSDGEWVFDVSAGKDEIINRRIGENELTAIGVCRTYVEGQREYASEDRNQNDVMEYAQRLKSTPGKKDGLVWDSAQGEPLSPLGPLIAQAHAEGYGKPDTTAKTVSMKDESVEQRGPRPFHGYLFKVLTRQGDKAPGGRMDYVINGHMVAGFALVAYPVEWGKSGVMTFVVNSNGKVYQKDLGEGTAEQAAGMEEYNPDKSWALVTEDPQ